MKINQDQKTFLVYLFGIIFILAIMYGLMFFAYTGKIDVLKEQKFCLNECKKIEEVNPVFSDNKTRYGFNRDWFFLDLADNQQIALETMRCQDIETAVPCENNIAYLIYPINRT